MIAHRACPVCDSPDSTLLYSQTFTDSTYQHVAACRLCGMCYASDSAPADYVRHSKYAVVESIGSGENDRERRRLRWMAQKIAEHRPRHDASILDIGCARGGLLDALAIEGYSDIHGVDPSATCVAVSLAKGYHAIQGTISDLPDWRYDVIVLSHVLEHLWEPRRALAALRDHLQPEGMFYLEVPDATRYADYLLVPYLDFNREHVNHFSMDALRDIVAKSDLRRYDWGERELETPHGAYPALWIVGGIEQGKPLGRWSWSRHTLLEHRLRRYVIESGRLLERIDQDLTASLAGLPEIALWGFGEFCQQLLRTRALGSRRIIQVVDRDPGKWGLSWNGLQVESPAALREGVPVLVASIVNRDSILEDVRKMRLANPVVTL